MTKTSDVDIVRFALEQNGSVLQSLVTCYRTVFGEPPWNEWMVCSVCGEKWGVNVRHPVEHCGGVVSEFWPEGAVEKDIRAEVTPDSPAWLAYCGEQVVGFCWGYAATPEDLARKVELPSLVDAIHGSFGVADQVAYQDEMGVISAFRGQGIARRMFDVRRTDFLQRGLKIGVIRTMRTPATVTYKWYTKLGYQVIAEYNDADDRVIMARTLADL